MIPNVRRAIPSGILPGPSGVVEVMVIIVVCERRLICATRQGVVLVRNLVSPMSQSLRLQPRMPSWTGYRSDCCHLKRNEQ